MPRARTWLSRYKSLRIVAGWSLRSAIAGEKKVREGLHGGKANGIGGRADVISEEAVGFGEGALDQPVAAQARMGACGVADGRQGVDHITQG